jgi:hypothetical protein
LEFIREIIKSLSFLFADLAMDTFYQDIESLDAFTLSLNALGEKVQCKHCHQSGQMVSHGFIYKQHSFVKKKSLSVNACFVPIDMAAQGAAKPISCMWHIAFLSCAMKRLSCLSFSPHC